MTSMDGLVGLGEAARLLGLSRAWTMTLARRGELRREMTSVGRYGYDRAEVEALAVERARLLEPGPKGWPRLRRDNEGPVAAMRMVGVRLPEHLQAVLRSRATACGTSPSAVFRELVERAADEDEELSRA